MEIASVVIPTECWNMIDEHLLVCDVATSVDREPGDAIGAIGGATVSALLVGVVEIDERLSGTEIRVDRDAEQTRLATCAGNGGQIESYVGSGGAPILTVENAALAGNQQSTVWQPVNRRRGGHIVDSQDVNEPRIRKAKCCSIGG